MSSLIPRKPFCDVCANENMIMTEGKQKLGFLEDDSGNRSSKRLFGAIILSTAIILSVVIIAIDLLNPMTNLCEASIKVLEFMYLSGTGLLGFGVLENLKVGRKNDD